MTPISRQVLSLLSDSAQSLILYPFDLSRFFALLLLTILSGFIGFFTLGWLLPKRLVSGSLIENAGFLFTLALAWPPIVLFLSDLPGSPISASYLWVVVLLLAGAGLAVWLHSRRFSKGFQFDALSRIDVYLIITFLLAAAVRTIQVQEILVPNWIDGYTHYQIAAKIIANGAHSFQRIYPTGLHAGWITSGSLFYGESLEECGLVFTQWLSLVSGLTFYSLLRQLIAPRAALIAAGFYWFVAPFPSYLIAWGRYPLLMGMVMLPPALWLLYQVRRSKPAAIYLAVIVMGGLALTHYGTFLLACITMPAMLLIPASAGQSIRKKIFPLIFPQIALAALPCIMLAPRIASALQKINAPSSDIFAYQSVHTLDSASYIVSKTFQGAGWLIWLAAAATVIYLALNRQRWIMMLAVTILSLLFSHAVMLWVFGSSLINLTNLLITSSVLLCGLLGFLLQAAGRWLTTTRPGRVEAKIIPAITFALILMAFVASGLNQMKLIPPETVLFHLSDLDAIVWIAESTHPNDRFLIHCSIYDSGNRCEPVDGGIWIEPLTGRLTTLFPDSEDFFEASGDLREHGIRYLYSSTGQNISGFEWTPDFHIVFSNGEVNVYQLSSALTGAKP